MWQAAPRWRPNRDCIQNSYYFMYGTQKDSNSRNAGSLGTSSIDYATTEPTLSIAYLKIKMAATMKRKKVSKNKKQTWRKHTDIKDVEEHLEEARREERTG